MDTFLSDVATVPQIVPTEQWRTQRMIKPLRTSCSKLVHDHEQSLLVNITTPSQYHFVRNS